jgi:hypothetical protein
VVDGGMGAGAIKFRVSFFFSVIIGLPLVGTR